MIKNICYDCMQPAKWLQEDDGNYICKECYIIRHNGIYTYNDTDRDPEPTFHNLKIYLEKKW